MVYPLIMFSIYINVNMQHYQFIIHKETPDIKYLICSEFSVKGKIE